MARTVKLLTLCDEISVAVEHKKMSLYALMFQPVYTDMVTVMFCPYVQDLLDNLLLNLVYF